MHNLLICVLIRENTFANVLLLFSDMGRISGLKNAWRIKRLVLSSGKKSYEIHSENSEVHNIFVILVHCSPILQTLPSHVILIWPKTVTVIAINSKRKVFAPLNHRTSGHFTVMNNITLNNRYSKLNWILKDYEYNNISELINV